MIAEWRDFYVATAGAAAALTGLIFVGISINISKILEHQALPTRASLALTLLMSILMFSIILLLPIESNIIRAYFFSAGNICMDNHNKGRHQDA